MPVRYGQVVIFPAKYASILFKGGESNISSLPAGVGDNTYFELLGVCGATCCRMGVNFGSLSGDSGGDVMEEVDEELEMLDRFVSGLDFLISLHNRSKDSLVLHLILFSLLSFARHVSVVGDVICKSATKMGRSSKLARF